jgi:hypothetical protein
MTIDAEDVDKAWWNLIENFFIVATTKVSLFAIYLEQTTLTMISLYQVLIFSYWNWTYLVIENT